MNQVFPLPSRAADEPRAHGVTAVLGPTNTGKTHYAIERMLGHDSGIIGLPLRLLAREVYNRVVQRVGAAQVALITGEEKIKPPRPRFWVATVEAMPRDLDVSFVAIDEIQLAADLDRGHVFTDRLLNRRGRHETLVLGAETMRRAVEQLLPGAAIVVRPRLSTLTFLGDRKLTRLPRRSAVVAFSAEEVYAIAELFRRQRGGAAVVLGALSPRTRNAQVAMYQDGEVDYIVSTDAIGMGLNLDVDHVAFAGDRKFDGWQFRRLNPAEFGQIAGRAGRHMRDGTFGTTGRCPPFDEDLVEALETHRFEPVATLQWRNSALDFGSIDALRASLDELPDTPLLRRAPLAEDVVILDIAARDDDVARAAKTGADVRRLWEACQIPDYRKLSPAAHADLVLTVFKHVVRAGKIPADWFARQLAFLDRVDGNIDALSARIAQVRTWTYIANRPDWLGDPEHWQGATRQVEDNLSDALHDRLTQRFVDRRTSVLLRRLRENAMLEAEVTPTGDVMVEGQHVGQLHGFRFTPDPQAAGEAARALNAAAQKALASEIEARANKVHEAVDEAFVLASDGQLRWLGETVGMLANGDKLLEPRIRVLADEQLTGFALETVHRRLDLWLAQHMKKLLAPLFELETGEGLEGIARGIAFQVAEGLGVLERTRVAEELKGLDQSARASLRKIGVRFGAYHLYLPQLLKPAPRSLAAQLWALSNSGTEAPRGLDEVPHLAASGRTSFRADKEVPKGLYRAAGFRVCGERAVRVDILERLADLIRPAINYRPGVSVGDPPPGTADRDGFVVTVAMTSLAGCSGDDFASILRSLGYMMDRRPGPPITVPLLQAASLEPAKVVCESTAGAAEAGLPPSAQEVPDGPPQDHGGGVMPHPSIAEETVDGEPADPPAFEMSSDPELPFAAPEPSPRAVSPPSAMEAVTAAEAAVAAAACGAQRDVAHGDSVGEPALASAAEMAQDAGLSPPETPALAPTRTEAITVADAAVSAAAIGVQAQDPPPDFGVAAGMRAMPAEVSGVPGGTPSAEGDDDQGAGPTDTTETLTSETPAESQSPGSVAPDAGHATAVGAVSAAEAEAPATVAEAPMIEVWRPHRHHHRPATKPGDRRARDRERHGASQRPAPTVDPPQAGVSAEAAPPQGERTTDREQFGRRHERPGRDPRRSDGGRRSAEAMGSESVRPYRERGHGGGSTANRQEGRSARHDNAAPQKPAPRDRAPDPDSPFAKLAALKAELERKAKDGADEKGNSSKKR